MECRICFNFTFNNIVCSDCVNRMRRYLRQCSICLDRCICKDNYISLFTYESVKSEILRLKYCKEYGLANVFSELSNLDIDENALWTCVPTTYGKMRDRGYNASLVLCSAFARKYNGYVNPFIFDMKEVNFEKNNERILRSIKTDRFFINESVVKDIKSNHIVIVDDVICTGATIFRLVELLREYTEIPITCIFIGKK